MTLGFQFIFKWSQFEMEAYYQERRWCAACDSREWCKTGTDFKTHLERRYRLTLVVMCDFCKDGHICARWHDVTCHIAGKHQTEVEQYCKVHPELVPSKVKDEKDLIQSLAGSLRYWGIVPFDPTLSEGPREQCKRPALKKICCILRKMLWWPQSSC